MATALAIINGAFDDIGVKQPGEALEAADVQDAFRRLNNFVGTLRTQSLTSLVVERQIFNLTAYQQQYFIGIGAEFNVPRPPSLNGAGLLLNGLSAPASVTITRSGDVATVHGYTGVSVGEEVYIAGCDDEAYNQTQVVTSVSAPTFTFTVFSAPVSPAAGSPTVQQFQDNPVEIPRSLLTDDGYQAIQIKNMTNAQFTNVYYNPTQPYGTIWLWPIPNTDQNQLVLYLPSLFQGFATLTTDYTFADVPGYAEMLEYGLAQRLLLPYAVKNDAIIGQVSLLARTSLALVKRQNYRLMDLPTDPALTGNRLGGYNINTDQGGY